MYFQLISVAWPVSMGLTNKQVKMRTMCINIYICLENDVELEYISIFLKKFLA